MESLVRRQIELSIETMVKKGIIAFYKPCYSMINVIKYDARMLRKVRNLWSITFALWLVGAVRPRP